MSISAAKLLVEVGADTKEAENKVGGFGNKLNKTAKNLGATGALLSATVTAPLLGIAGAALNSAMGFEQSMNVLQQVTGATASDMAGLQEQAIQLGADTVFSAGEAAEAMLELGKAGMGTEQIMAAIPGVMDLAAAGGVSLAEAASLTAATLNAFHLEASESARIADLLAATANASAADISDLGAGMQQAGFAFSMANQPVDNLAASLAILTNVGLTGSDAGTALKNAFMRMMNPTKEAASLMQELGINFYDANGQMKDLPLIIDNLNTAMADLTPQQRDAALATIFLSDGMKAMIPLMDAGKEGFLQTRETVNQFGASSEVADARMKGLAGAIEEVKGSLDSFLLGTVLPFLGTLAPMVRQVGNLFDWFGALPQPVKNAALAFLGVLAAAGPIIALLGALAGAVAFLISPLGLLIAGVALLAAAWTANFGGIQEKTAAVIATVAPYFQQLVGWFQGLIQQGINFANQYRSTFDGFITNFQGMVAQVPGFVAQLQTGFDNVKMAVEDAGLASLEAREAWSTMPGILAPLGPVITGVAGAFNILWAALSGQGASSGGQVAVWKELVTDAFGPGTLAAILGFVDSFRAMMGQFQMIWAQVVSFLSPMIARVQEAFSGLGGNMAELGPKFSALGAAVLPLLQQLGQIAAWVAQVLGVVLVGAISLFGNMLAAVLNNLPGLIGIVVDQFTLMLNTVTTILGGLIKMASSLIQGDWAGVWEGAKQVLLGFWNFVAGTLVNLGGLIGTIFKTILDTATGFLSDLGLDATDEIDAMTKTVQDFWDWLTGLSWDAVWGDISTGFAGIVDNLLVWEWPSPAELLDWVWPRADDLLNWVWPRAADLLDWDWPSLADLLNWDWPGLPTWTWPSIPTPGWVNRLIDFLSGWSIPGFASGTNFAPGGMALVGERGPELVHLPRGSRVFNNGETKDIFRRARRGGEEPESSGGVTVIIEHVTLANEMDIHTTVRKIGREVNRKVRS